MPWTEKDYPASMKNLPEKVRNKAIEMANAMLDDGYEEGRAIAIAQDQAREWAAHHGEDGGAERLHVEPNGDGWAIRSEDADSPSDTFDTKDHAVERARKMAHERKTRLAIHRSDGTIQEQHDYSD